MNFWNKHFFDLVNGILSYTRIYVEHMYLHSQSGYVNFTVLLKIIAIHFLLF